MTCNIVVKLSHNNKAIPAFSKMVDVIAEDFKSKNKVLKASGGCLVMSDDKIINHFHKFQLQQSGQSAYAKTKTQISFSVTAKLISSFVFTTGIVEFLCFLNPKVHASKHLL